MPGPGERQASVSLYSFTLIPFDVLSLLLMSPFCFPEIFLPCSSFPAGYYFHEGFLLCWCFLSHYALSFFQSNTKAQSINISSSLHQKKGTPSMHENVM